MNNEDDFRNPLELDDEVINVYIPENDITGSVIQLGAYASMVEYSLAGVKYQIEMLNEDFIVVDEVGIGYQSEEDL